MSPTMYIKLSNTFPHVQPHLACRDANIHICIEEIMQRREEIMQTERLKPKISCNVRCDTMLDTDCPKSLSCQEMGPTMYIKLSTIPTCQMCSYIHMLCAQGVRLGLLRLLDVYVQTWLELVRANEFEHRCKLMIKNISNAK